MALGESSTNKARWSRSRTICQTIQTCIRANNARLGRSYLVRIPKGWNPERQLAKSDPIVFIHGLGFGLLSVSPASRRFIRSLIQRAKRVWSRSPKTCSSSESSARRSPHTRSSSRFNLRSANSHGTLVTYTRPRGNRSWGTL